MFDIVSIVAFVAAIFWLSQLTDLLLRDVRYFESQNQKLLWFLVVFVGNIIGAIWYYAWKRQAFATVQDDGLEIRRQRQDHTWEEDQDDNSPTEQKN